MSGHLAAKCQGRPGPEPVPSRIAKVAAPQELATAATNTDSQQRTQQYNDAEQKIVNDVGWIPLIQGSLDVLINPKVQNLAANGPTKTWSDVYISV